MNRTDIFRRQRSIHVNNSNFSNFLVWQLQGRNLIKWYIFWFFPILINSYRHNKCIVSFYWWRTTNNLLFDRKIKINLPIHRTNHFDRSIIYLGMTERGYYVIDLSLVHAIIFILPCIIITLFKLWTKIVAKRQAEIITRKLNEELVKLV